MAQQTITVYRTQHLALTTIAGSARFLSVKFCRHGHILSQ